MLNFEEEVRSLQWDKKKFSKWTAILEMVHNVAKCEIGNLVETYKRSIVYERLEFAEL